MISPPSPSVLAMAIHAVRLRLRSSLRSPALPPAEGAFLWHGESAIALRPFFATSPLTHPQASAAYFWPTAAMAAASWPGPALHPWHKQGGAFLWHRNERKCAGVAWLHPMSGPATATPLR